MGEAQNQPFQLSFNTARAPRGPNGGLWTNEIFAKPREIWASGRI
jgi:hypothetical protein